MDMRPYILWSAHKGREGFRASTGTSAVRECPRVAMTDAESPAPILYGLEVLRGL